MGVWNLEMWVAKAFHRKAFYFRSSQVRPRLNFNTYSKLIEKTRGGVEGVGESSFQKFQRWKSN